MHGPHQADQSICGIGLGQNVGRGYHAAGTGTLAGIISNSQLKDVIIDSLASSGLPAYLLAPISGAFMSLATASTTAGTAVASSVFGSTIMGLGVASWARGDDSRRGDRLRPYAARRLLPRNGRKRQYGDEGAARLIPYETAIGLVLAVVSTLVFGVFGWFL